MYAKLLPRYPGVTGYIEEAHMSEQFSKPAQLAKELHKTEGTLANWRCQKKGPPFVKIGSSVLYPRDKLEVWLESRLVETCDAA